MSLVLHAVGSELKYREANGSTKLIGIHIATALREEFGGNMGR